jgi:mannuronan 5-epimerase
LFFYLSCVLPLIKIAVILLLLLSLSTLLLLFSIQSWVSIAAIKTTTISSSSSPCITYDSSKNLIKITCSSANLTDIYNQLHNESILRKQQQSSSPVAAAAAPDTREWLLNANITIAKGATLYINSTDTSWLKIISDGTSNTAYAIEVYGSLKIDSVKVTSWNPTTNNYIRDDNNTGKIPRPFIRVEKDATGTTDITNSEIAYLGYQRVSGEEHSGLSYYGGNGSVLRGNNIHNLWFGFYSTGVAGIVVENNQVHDNSLYAFDPHTGTHDMIFRNNRIYNNVAQGIICSLDCYNITIENNQLYNNGIGTTESSGIMFSRNMSNSVARNNIIRNETQGIFVSSSHSNEVYNNTISDSTVGIYVRAGAYTVNGIYTTAGAYNNTIHHNIIINPLFSGIVVNRGASENRFYSNIVQNPKHYAIDIEDSNTTKNTFKDNHIINSSSDSPIRQNTNNTTNTIISPSTNDPIIVSANNDANKNPIQDMKNSVSA